MLDQVRRTSAADIAGAIVLAVTSIDAPTELNSRSGVTNGALVLVTQNVAGANEWTLYAFDATSSASVNSPYIVAASGSGQWVSVAGKYTNSVIGGESLTVNPGSSSAYRYSLYGRTDLTFPVPSVRPTTATKGMAFDIMPNGSPGDVNGIAPCWFDLCSTDIVADSTNYECLRFAKKDSSYGYIECAKGGTGTVRTLALQPSNGRVLVGTSTDDGVSALQIVGATTATSIALTGAWTAGASSTLSGGAAGSMALAVVNTTAGTGSFARISAKADVATTLAVDMFASTYTGASWGITLASYAVISASSTTSNGLIIGHTSNKPVIFAINTNEVARYTSGTLTTGGFSLAYTTDSTSTTTGSIICPGGVGIAKAAFIGTTLNVAGVATLASTTDATTAAAAGALVSGGLGIAKNVISAKGQGWGVTSTATAAGTTTLTSTSTVIQMFTGSTTQTINFPAANLFGAGIAVMFVINNQSSGTVTPTRAGSDTFQGGGTTDPVLAGVTQWYASNGVSLWAKV